MQHYLMLSRRNFYAEKQHTCSNKVLSFGARGFGNYASPCINRHITQHSVTYAQLSPDKQQRLHRLETVLTLFTF